nr:DUF4924 family protein [uncultured Porphyromonas sp.]
MIIAQQKRKENIAEYLLYMWQVEDLIRATGVSIEGVEEHLLPRYDVDEETRQAIRTWYQELIDMMRSEGKVKAGHLDINRIVLMQLEELHRRLLGSANDIVYSGLHLQILPALIQLRTKGNHEGESDLETCFNALYGYITLSLQQKEVSEETKKSMKQISALLALLAHRYKMEQEGIDPETNPNN